MRVTRNRGQETQRVAVGFQVTVKSLAGISGFQPSALSLLHIRGSVLTWLILTHRRLKLFSNPAEDEIAPGAPVFKEAHAIANGLAGSLSLGVLKFFLYEPYQRSCQRNSHTPIVP